MHESIIKVRYKDLDTFNHVNNANFLTYAEEARSSFLTDVIGTDLDWKQFGIILGKATLDFLHPIPESKFILIESHIARLGNKSFTMQHLIYDTEKITCYAQAEIVVVCYDYYNGKSIGVPLDWRNKLAAHLSQF